MPLRCRGPLRALSVIIGTAAAAVAGISAALAHVEVRPDSVEAGTYPVFTFVVPNERKGADTVEVELALPDDAPFAYVAVRSQPGWQSTVTKRQLPSPVENHGSTVTETVAVVTWTGGAIPPGQFTDFAVEMGPVPESVQRLVFGAVQTYSDGTEVRWNESVSPGAPDPEQPAPTVAVTAAGAGAGEEDASTAAAPSTSQGSGAATTVLAACALGFSLVAMIAAVAALAAGRRQVESPPEVPSEEQ